MRTSFFAKEKDDLLLLEGSVEGGTEGDPLLLEGGGEEHHLEGVECSKEEEEEVRGGTRALRTGTGLTRRLMAPLRMVPGAVAGRPQVAVCT